MQQKIDLRRFDDKNETERRNETIQDDCKTRNGARLGNLGSEESTQGKNMDVAEMRMLRWMSGVSKLDRIGNERIRGTTKVGEMSTKVHESRLGIY